MKALEKKLGVPDETTFNVSNAIQFCFDNMDYAKKHSVKIGTLEIFKDPYINLFTEIIVWINIMERPRMVDLVSDFYKTDYREMIENIRNIKFEFPTQDFLFDELLDYVSGEYKNKNYQNIFDISG